MFAVTFNRFDAESDRFFGETQTFSLLSSALSACRWAGIHGDWAFVYEFDGRHTFNESTAMPVEHADPDGMVITTKRRWAKNKRNDALKEGTLRRIRAAQAAKHGFEWVVTDLSDGVRRNFEQDVHAAYEWAQNVMAASHSVRVALYDQDDQLVEVYEQESEPDRQARLSAEKFFACNKKEVRHVA